MSNDEWEGGHYVEKADKMIPEEAVTLHKTVTDVPLTSIGSLTTYGMDRMDKLRGILYVGLLLITTAVAGFFLGRESLRHYPDPTVQAPETKAPIIQLFVPTTPAVEPEEDSSPRLWPS